MSAAGRSGGCSAWPSSTAARSISSSNVGALLDAGRLTEALTGRARLGLVFSASVAAGSLASLVLLPEVPSVGASAGILGLIGFLAVVGLRRRAILPAGFVWAVLRSIGFIAVAGVVGYRFIDNAAHAGGLIAGAAVGVLAVPVRGSLPVATPTPVAVLGLAGWILLAGAALRAARVLLFPVGG
ncbi:MAG: rhomboid family intramembrane serine protease [Acidobacteria bacterium]|nr:rhomboid family intramembrane serine protease [Acidobacteriota bacterium]